MFLAQEDRLFLAPVALASVVYYDQRSPRQAYRRMYRQLLETASERIVCKRIVDIPAVWGTSA